MASGFFALLDDIAAIMDDVAAMTKITTKKTAGILGDDLAVNAEKASGFVSSREIPVLWAITKGSFLNKLIILPIAFLLSAFVPWAVIVILVLGGLYLAYEGAEKIFEFFVPHPKQHKVELKKNLTDQEVLDLEKGKIKSAVVTDFILSVEIVIIALGSVVNEPLGTQIMVVSIVSLIATVGVYGIVALIVRMDDLGLKLISKSIGDNGFLSTVGTFLVQALPKVIKSLAVIGTIALILVAGGIFVHNIEFLHHFLEQIPSILRDFIVGLAVGALCLLVVKAIKKLLRKKRADH
jgi:predicted DNA repair protein MutK